MRDTLGKATLLALTVAFPACIIGDLQPFADNGSDCLEAGEEVIEIELSDAKTPASLDAATVPTWRLLPDSTADQLHLVVAGCPEDRETQWLTVDVRGQSPEGFGVRSRTSADPGGEWLQAPSEGDLRYDPTFELYTVGGDLELLIDLTEGRDGPSRAERLAVGRICGESQEEIDMREFEEGEGEDWYDEGC